MIKGKKRRTENRQDNTGHQEGYPSKKETTPIPHPSPPTRAAGFLVKQKNIEITCLSMFIYA
jgi:hypothetical protein